jgi:hypothetical protein
MVDRERLPDRTIPEIRAIRDKTRQGNTPSEKRAQPSQTPQSASPTSCHPTQSAQLGSHTHNHKPLARRSDSPPTAQRSISCRAHTPSVSESNLSGTGPRQLLLGGQGDREVSPRQGVDLMVLIPMPQPGPPAAPSQRVTSAALVESQGEAEELGTASSTSERIKQSDRPQRPETSENGQKHQNNSPSTAVQKSQDATAEHGPDNQAKSSNKAPKPETRPAVVEASHSLFTHRCNG